MNKMVCWNLKRMMTPVLFAEVKVADECDGMHYSLRWSDDGDDDDEGGDDAGDCANDCVDDDAGRIELVT